MLKNRAIWTPVLVAIGVIVLWEACVRIFDVPLYILPAPTKILEALAENRSDSLRDTEARQERDVVTLNRGSGYEDVVVTEQTYPVYQGAVIVCQGAGDSGVHLAVVQAVSVLTGLGSDKITVVQWK